MKNAQVGVPFYSAIPPIPTRAMGGPEGDGMQGFQIAPVGDRGDGVPAFGPGARHWGGSP